MTLTDGVARVARRGESASARQTSRDPMIAAYEVCRVGIQTIRRPRPTDKCREPRDSPLLWIL
jgi:hypothetical protein